MAFTNPLTYLILISLALACTAFAWLCIRPIRRRRHNHGQTAIFVIIGDSLVALAAVLIVAANGPVNAMDLSAILIAALAAGGLPVVAEYISAHLDHAEDVDQRRVLDAIDAIMSAPDEED